MIQIWIKSVTACGKLQADLGKLMNRSLEWKLSFNTSKCQVMHLGKNNGKLSYRIGVSQTHPLTMLKDEKDLCVLFDSSMEFSKHCTKSAAKANSVVGPIKRTFTSVNISVFTTLYKTMVRPIMEYTICMWSPYLIKGITLLENAQKRATRMCPN